MTRIRSLLLLLLLALTGCAALQPATAPDSPSATAMVAEAAPTVTTAPTGSAQPPLDPPPTVTTAPTGSAQPPLDPPPTVTTALTSAATAIVIDLRNEQGQPGLTADCPSSFCDGGTYQAYRYDSPQVFLYLSFDPELADATTGEDLVAHFNYINMELRFPERTTVTSTFFYGNFFPIEQIGQPNRDGVTFELLDYSDGRMRGRLSGVATKITELRMSSEPGCYTDDMGGICYRDEPAELPFTITFDLSLDNGSA